MPRTDGVTLIERIRSLPDDAGGQTPALALTAFVQPKDRIQALASGFDGFVTKPIDEDELVVVCASLARRKRKHT
jgi:CheY-like chemotaxis protein